MKLSLSVRVAETTAKDRITIEFAQLAQLARQTGYDAICMRPSVAGVQTAEPVRARIRAELARHRLAVSMATTDLSVPLNNEHGPDMLRDMTPHLDLAASIGATLIRVCMKHDDDIPAAQHAADQAAQRGIALAHQCHTDSLFETVRSSIDTLKRIDRSNFGIIFEPANLMLCGDDYGPSAITKLAPYIRNVYVQNHRMTPAGKQSIFTRARGDVRYDLIPLWETAGNGTVDFESVFRGLHQIDYQGFVTVHQAFGELMGPAQAAEHSARFLKSIARFEPPLEIP